MPQNPPQTLDEALKQGGVINAPPTLDDALKAGGRIDGQQTQDPGYLQTVIDRLGGMASGAAQAWKAGDVPTMMGLTGLQSQADYIKNQPTMLGKAVSEIPFFGPSLNESMTAWGQGKPKEAAGILTSDILIPGMVGKGISRIGEASVGLTPEKALVKAVKPGKNNISFANDMKLAIPLLKETEQIRGLPITGGLQEVSDIIPMTKQRVWDKYAEKIGLTDVNNPGPVFTPKISSQKLLKQGQIELGPSTPPPGTTQTVLSEPSISTTFTSTTQPIPRGILTPGRAEGAGKFAVQYERGKQPLPPLVTKPNIGEGITAEGVIEQAAKDRGYSAKIKEPFIPGSEPRIPEGMTRLYRVQSKNTSNARLPSWLQTEHMGRWFTADKSHLDWYMKDTGESAQIYYIDVPQNALEKFRASNQKDIIRYSGNPEAEFYLPKNIAEKKIALKNISEYPYNPPTTSTTVKGKEAFTAGERYPEAVAEQISNAKDQQQRQWIDDMARESGLLRRLQFAAKRSANPIPTKFSDVFDVSYPGMIDGNKIADAIQGSITKMTRQENPGISKRIEVLADGYRRPIGVKEAESFLSQTNGILAAWYKKNQVERSVAERANPVIAAQLAKADAIRDLLYSKIDEVAGPGASDLKMQYGALLNLEREVTGRGIVAARQAPASLSEQIGKWSGTGQVVKGLGRAVLGVGTIDPLNTMAGIAEILAAKQLKKMNTSDYLINQAISKWGGARPESGPVMGTLSQTKDATRAMMRSKWMPLMSAAVANYERENGIPTQ